MTGKFPQLSETFIFRKVVMLAKRGHHVIVATRDPGDWSFFEDQLPLHENIVIKILIPDTRIFEPHRFIRFLRGLARGIISHPGKAYILWRSCRESSTTKLRAFKLFVRYLPLIDLDVDLIHFEFVNQHAMYEALSKYLQVPYVVSCRGADIHLFHQYRAKQQEQIIKSLQSAAAIHVVSDEMRGEVTRISGRTESVWVNRPAVPVSEISSRSYPPTQSIPVILAVGRLVWKKGYDYLLAALQRIKQDGIQFQARILGDGELRTVLQFSVYDLGLTDEVELCGSVKPSEVLRQMQLADIFVLSSHEEGISNAVLEAMASGLPIITTNAGGMPEAVRDGVDGFVVPVRDINALAARIKQLLLDEDLRVTMGRSARLQAENKFSLQRQTDIFEQIYKSVLNDRL